MLWPDSQPLTRFIVGQVPFRIWIGSAGFKTGQPALKRATGFETGQVANRVVIYTIHGLSACISNQQVMVGKVPRESRVMEPLRFLAVMISTIL